MAYVLIQQGKKSSPMTSLPAATTSNEQDHDNAMFGCEHVSLSTAQSSVVQEEPMAASVKVYALLLCHFMHTTHCIYVCISIITKIFQLS